MRCIHVYTTLYTVLFFKYFGVVYSITLSSFSDLLVNTGYYFYLGH